MAGLPLQQLQALYLTGRLPALNMASLLGNAALLAQAQTLANSQSSSALGSHQGADGASHTDPGVATTSTSVSESVVDGTDMQNADNAQLGNMLKAKLDMVNKQVSLCDMVVWALMRMEQLKDVQETYTACEKLADGAEKTRRMETALKEIISLTVSVSHCTVLLLTPVSVRNNVRKRRCA
jgi:hypothetical protein